MNKSEISERAARAARKIATAQQAFDPASFPLAEHKIADLIIGEWRELGDGEPSPPPCEHERLDADGTCKCGWSVVTREAVESGAAQEVSPRARAMKIAKEIDQECIHQDDMGHTFEVSRAAAIIEKEYGVEEVSPPSPEPVCPMCCKPVFTDGYEGDTRELKAALRKLIQNSSRHDHDDARIVDATDLIEVERFLGL